MDNMDTDNSNNTVLDAVAQLSPPEKETASTFSEQQMTRPGCAQDGTISCQLIAAAS